MESPEALLRAMDLELAAQRAKRGDSQNRHIVLAVGLLLVMAIGAIALFFLFSMVNDLPRPQGAPSPEAQASTHP